MSALELDIWIVENILITLMIKCKTPQRVIDFIIVAMWNADKDEIVLWRVIKRMFEDVQKDLGYVK